METWRRAALLIKPFLPRRRKIAFRRLAAAITKSIDAPLPDATDGVEGREGVVARGATVQAHVPCARATVLSSGPKEVGGVAQVKERAVDVGLHQLLLPRCPPDTAAVHAGA